MVLGPWGLIPDFFRLLDFAGRDDREAFLVLVVDERSPKDQSLARGLRGINFLSPSRDVRFPAGVIRIWSVLASAAQQGTPNQALQQTGAEGGGSGTHRSPSGTGY
jgi:hypothetical protein